MIQVSDFSKDQIGQVEYLIQQSIRGNHVLFDVDTLRKVLAPETSYDLLQNLTEDEANSVEQHIESLIRQPTLAQKRAYLEKLDVRIFAWVVKTYFNIIENNLYESQKGYH